MNYFVKVLRETPFHKGGDIVSFKEFRRVYNHICVNSVTDEELYDYLVRDGSFRDWFVAEMEMSDAPMSFIHNGLVYSKELSGMYHVFPVGIERKPDNALYLIHTSAARELFRTAKYKQLIWVCTNAINAKL